MSPRLGRANRLAHVAQRMLRHDSVPFLAQDETTVTWLLWPVAFCNRNHYALILRTVIRVYSYKRVLY